MAHDPLAAVNTALAGKYVAEGEIGKGGAARVYRARDKGGRIVALKALHPELLVSSAAERFLQEVRMAGELSHPHIVPLLDSGTAGWLVYYVMPYIEGPSLRQAIDQRGPLPVSEVIAIACDVLDALAHAHQRGLVHRDIKPDNILISPTGGAMLLDFGIGRAVEATAAQRLTAAGMTVGTAAYMSPEQVTAASDLDQRSDLYSLGCVLFECVTARTPFVEGNEFVVMRHHVTTPAPAVTDLQPGTPGALAAMIQRALCKGREERWQSAEEMRAALGAAPPTAAATPATSGTVAPAAPPREPARRGLSRFFR